MTKLEELKAAFDLLENASDNAHADRDVIYGQYDIAAAHADDAYSASKAALIAYEIELEKQTKETK